jgi:hypothetical protein
VAPFIQLITKDQPFFWGVGVDNAFQFLHVFFTTTLLLIHANLSKIFVLELNVFDFAIGMSQMPMPWVHSFECLSMIYNELVFNY